MLSFAALICMGTAMVALSIAGAAGGLLADDVKQGTQRKDDVGFSIREEGCPAEDYAYPFQRGLTVSDWFGQHVSFTGNASDEGYMFTLTALSASAGENITLGTAFTITNSETQLKLGWQFSAWHQRVILSLVENSSMATKFHLVQACNVSLPCPDTTGARCKSYFLLRTGLSGFTGVGSVTDIWPQWIVPADAGSSGNIPLLLREGLYQRQYSSHCRSLASATPPCDGKDLP
ncbi:hypothetical protein GOP47_0017767 [Adiantum capillus-veneris]|uniref:Uncharacterized protein n=1 Tax=Adiantum capillus-veneris TaxID=13818 RepID=A0A9D4ZA02_ADICA|nr:hypothetical protein GOP47_0017767 [Adiantum capillus-veneris]